MVIHELGTQGLQHCTNVSYFMRDAGGSNTTNDERVFCQHCKIYLSIKDGFLDNFYYVFNLLVYPFVNNSNIDTYTIPSRTKSCKCRMPK